MAIQKVPARAIESSASSANLNIDAGTLYLDASNNRVGVGTTSPNYKLHTYGTDGTAYTSTGSSARTPSGALITAQSANATVGVSATIDMISNGQHAWIGAVDDASGYTPSMVFGQSTGASAWTERMRIDTSGRLGIATSTPEGSLHVNGANGQIILSAGNAPSSGASTNKWKIGLREAVEGDFNVQHYNGTSYDTLMNIRGDGNVVLLPQGKLQFPASQSASSDPNTLDDYEEGTWTPTATADTPPSGTSYSIRSGTYRKVGQVVTVMLRIVATGWGSGASGSFMISGLPFTALSQGFNHPCGGFYMDNPSMPSGRTWAVPQTVANSTFITMIASGSAVGATTMAWSQITAGNDIAIGLTYFAAS